MLQNARSISVEGETGDVISDEVKSLLLTKGSETSAALLGITVEETTEEPADGQEAGGTARRRKRAATADNTDTINPIDAETVSLSVYVIISVLLCLSWY